MNKQIEALNMVVAYFKSRDFDNETYSVFTKCVEALAEAKVQESLNLKCKSVQKRLATQWGYVKAEAEKQEPVCSKCGKPTQQGECFYGCRQEQPAQSACEECIGFNKQLAAENDELKRQNDALRYKLSEPWKPLQSAQEPVAWRVLIDEAPQDTDWFYMTGQCWDVFKRFAEPLYTHTATWQSLSDDDVKAIEEVLGIDKVYIRAIERTLKEKNGMG